MELVRVLMEYILISFVIGTTASFYAHITSLPVAQVTLQVISANSAEVRVIGDSTDIPPFGNTWREEFRYTVQGNLDVSR